jgi:hypothetical protein
VEEKILQPIRLNVDKFKREYKRLAVMTTYQRALDVAIDKKADKWLDYVPLSKAQLFDDEMKNITVVSTFANGELSSTRSTHRGGGFHTQYTVLARPTEMKAILHAQGLLVLESDFVVVRLEPVREIRWCIKCKTHHAISDFKYQPKRYLNGFSFACRRALDDGKKGTWKYAA